MNYAFQHQDTCYGPNGRLDIDAAKADDYNKAQEQVELDWLKTSPDKVFLYVGANGHLTTWLGTVISTEVQMGARAYVGFDRYTYRRPLTALIFGTLYHGWYMESSGNYCRLKKAKRQ